MLPHDLRRVIAVALAPWIRLHVALVSPATCRLGAGPPHDGPAVGRSRVRPHTRFRLGTFWEMICNVTKRARRAVSLAPALWPHWCGFRCLPVRFDAPSGT